MSALPEKDLYNFFFGNTVKVGLKMCNSSESFRTNVGW